LSLSYARIIALEFAVRSVAMIPGKPHVAVDHQQIPNDPIAAILRKLLARSRIRRDNKRDLTNLEPCGPLSAQDQGSKPREHM
jgi:hypothetical protein